MNPMDFLLLMKLAQIINASLDIADKVKLNTVKLSFEAAMIAS